MNRRTTSGRDSQPHRSALGERATGKREGGSLCTGAGKRGASPRRPSTSSPTAPTESAAYSTSSTKSKPEIRNPKLETRAPRRKRPAHLFLEANRNLFSDHCALLPLDDPRVKELPR